MISIAKQFSDVPSGRFPEDGEFCGENFRERILLPALRSNRDVIIDFDGVEGLGSSFLEEAFGGLIRHGYFKMDELKSKLQIRTSQPEFQPYVHLAWSHMRAAKFGAEKPLAAAG